jgi:hypothetical protein
MLEKIFQKKLIVNEHLREMTSCLKNLSHLNIMIII